LAEFEGEMMGMPFKGFGINGYDPDKKKHVGAWVDSMSSEMLLVEGECSKDCQKQTLSAMGKDQATGKPVRFKMLAEHQDADHRTFEMEPEGQPGHEMKITYTRKK
jgi:hypothetical protein